MSTKTDFVFVLGTRPEIIKLAPVIRECRRRGRQFSIIHTGQHYSKELDEVFFNQLNLPSPDYNLEVGSGPHGMQTGEMVIGVESLLLEKQPNIVLAQGDTNSTLAASIATSKLDAKLGHVEAGLRSFDRSMPEEINRILTDHTSDYLFAPTDESASQLINEGLPGDRIFVTGNTIVDVLYEHRQFAEDSSDVLDRLDLESKQFALVTAHRAENVDNIERFENALTGIDRIAHEFDLDVLYPMHPRAKERCEEFNLSIPDSIQILEPLDYLDFLRLEEEASIIFTDSGGIQEEACVLGVPCVTLRDNTERPETLTVGANTLAGVNPNAILESASEMLSKNTSWENPFGDGTAAEQIFDAIAGVNTKTPT